MEAEAEAVQSVQMGEPRMSKRMFLSCISMFSGGVLSVAGWPEVLSMGQGRRRLEFCWGR